ncbi:MAG: InlB B-repeat-containing protein [Clostridia bacterium]|nr:InlB B-repeat-containing protein [Clostridia bacterium]
MCKITRKISFITAMFTVLASVLVTPLFSHAESYTNYEINGVIINAASVSSSPNECWAYANGIYALIWGQNFNSYFDSEDNLLRGLRDEELTLTAEHLKEYISAAPLGCSLRVCNEPNLHANDGYINGARPGHNQIIVAKDEEGFTVVQGGLTPEPHFREDRYTWQEFIDCWWLGGTYNYIKYIKWPKAPSYAAMRMENKSAPEVYDAVYPSGTLMYDKKFSLSGVIYSPHRMTGVTAAVNDMMGNAILYFDKRLSSNSYSIANEGLDAQMPFRALTPGGYTYEVKVTDITGAEYTVIKSFFTVAASKLVNEEIIFNFLINNGFNLAAACGVLANIEHESYFNPRSLYWEKGEYYSYGLIQWNHGRYDRMLDFFVANGYIKDREEDWNKLEDKKLIEAQLRFMMHELTTDTGSYKKAWQTVCSAPNTADGAYRVAYDWCYYYEMPSDTANRSDQRGTLARSYFERYSAYAGDHQVSFDARGAGNFDSVAVSYAAPYPELPAVQAPGREFLGWFTMPEGGKQVKKGDTVWITSDQLLFAHFRNKEYAIRYVLYDDETADGVYTYGSGLTLPLTFEREGYYFEGWYETPDFSGKPIRALSDEDYGDKVYYAKWRLYTGLLPSNNGFFYLRNGEKATGFIKVGGNTLYFRASDGYMMHYPTAQIGGKSYSFEAFNYRGYTLYRLTEEKNGVYAEENGVRFYRGDVMQTGWQTPEGGGLMYFDPETGLMQKELTLNGRDYTFEKYFLPDQALWDLPLWRVIKNGLYGEDGGVRFYQNSVALTGWRSFDGKSVYFDPETGLMVTEEREIDGLVHPFAPFEYEGFTLYADDYKRNGFFEEQGNIRFYVDDVFVTGWYDFGYNRMFFDTDSGLMLRISRTLGGEWYDFEPFEYEGLTLYRVAKRGFYSEDGGIRYYEEGGYATGWKDFEDGKLYFDPASGLMQSSDRVIDGIRHSFEPFEYGGMTLYRTAYHRNGLFVEKGGAICLYENYEPQTGFRTVGDNTLYFNKNGVMMHYGQVNISALGKTCEFEEYTDDTLTAWVYDPGTRGYKPEKGVTVWRLTSPKEGFFPEDGGIRYYADGTPLSGLQKIGEDRFFFDTESFRMITSTATVGDAVYEFEPVEYGAMTLYRVKSADFGIDVDNATIGHVTLALDFLSGAYAGEGFTITDVDGDGALTIADVTALLDILAGAK